MKNKKNQKRCIKVLTALCLVMPFTNNITMLNVSAKEETDETVEYEMMFGDQGLKVIDDESNRFYTDFINFGDNEYGNNLHWRVLNVDESRYKTNASDNNTLSLRADIAIADKNDPLLGRNVVYNDSADPTYQNSTIDKYLANEFPKTFTDKELNEVITSKRGESTSRLTNTKTGKNLLVTNSKIDDKFFLLSMDDYKFNNVTGNYWSGQKSYTSSYFKNQAYESDNLTNGAVYFDEVWETEFLAVTPSLDKNNNWKIEDKHDQLTVSTNLRKDNIQFMHLSNEKYANSVSNTTTAKSLYDVSTNRNGSSAYDLTFKDSNQQLKAPTNVKMEYVYYGGKGWQMSFDYDAAGVDANRLSVIVTDKSGKIIEKTRVLKDISKEKTGTACFAFSGYRNENEDRRVFVYTHKGSEQGDSDYCSNLQEIKIPDIKRVENFKIDGMDAQVYIDDADREIMVNFPVGTNMTSVKPIIQLNPGSSLMGIDVSKEIDLSQETKFGVKSMDGTTTEYTILPQSNYHNLDSQVKNVKVEGEIRLVGPNLRSHLLPYGTDFSKLKTNFEFYDNDNILAYDSDGKQIFSGDELKYTYYQMDDWKTAIYLKDKNGKELGHCGIYVTEDYLHDAEMKAINIKGQLASVKSGSRWYITMPQGTDIYNYDVSSFETDIDRVPNDNRVFSLYKKERIMDYMEYTLLEEDPNSTDPTQSNFHKIIVYEDFGNDTELKSFTIEGQFSSKIDHKNRTVSIALPKTKHSPNERLKYEHITAPGSGVMYKSTSTNGFDYFRGPKFMNVYGDVNTATYTLYTSFVEDANVVLSGSNYITDFNFKGQLSSSINNNNNTINITMPYGTDLSNMTPTIKVSDDAFLGLNCKGITNFTSPLRYDVIAQNGDFRSYTLNVKVAAQTPPDPTNPGPVVKPVDPATPTTPLTPGVKPADPTTPLTPGVK
ncbi:MAG: DUF6273 domain-containing protein, partial [Erysipelotrichaceae bacterium]